MESQRAARLYNDKSRNKRKVNVLPDSTAMKVALDKLSKTHRFKKLDKKPSLAMPKDGDQELDFGEGE